MSQNGNDGDIIIKKNLFNQKSTITRYIDLEFAHKSPGGETFVNFSSLNTPPEYVALDGFINPEPDKLIAAQIKLNKANVEVRSTGPRGILFSREDYVIKSNGGIHLLYETEENEIISGTIRSIVRNQPALVDATKIMKTGTLAEGQTTFVIGSSFKANENATEQIGSIFVQRFAADEDPKLMFRNIGNLPSGEGNYYEIDGGNGYSNAIEFNEPGRAGGENIVVYSHALQVSRPQVSYLQELETLGGQVDSISSFLQDIHSLTSNPFQGSPNQIDLTTFGDKVSELFGIIKGSLAIPASFLTKLKLVFGKTLFQTKILTADNNGGNGTVHSDLTFNNLTIGRSYRITGVVRIINQNGGNDLIAVHNGVTVARTRHYDGDNGPNSTCPIYGFFTATTTVLTFETAFKNGSSTISGDPVDPVTAVTLEELPNHEATTQWT
jgi:hypothetical protein